MPIIGFVVGSILAVNLVGTYLANDYLTLFISFLAGGALGFGIGEKISKALKGKDIYGRDID